MIGRLNHVAIAVKDLTAAVAVYKDGLGAQVTDPLPQPEHGVTVVFITLPNTKIELLEPLGEGSPIAKFLEKNPDGGIHHVCYEVDDVIAARDRLKSQGARVLGDGTPKIGAHGKPVLFLHPKDFCGTLVELEQACRPRVAHGYDPRHRDLHLYLVDHAVCGVAIRRSHTARGRQGRAWYARECARKAAALARVRDQYHRRDDRFRHRLFCYRLSLDRR